MAAIFKSSLQNLSPLLTSLKFEPLAKPKTSLKLFVNTTKPKTKVFFFCFFVFFISIFGYNMCVYKDSTKRNINQ